jgi:hypothetical protein
LEVEKLVSGDKWLGSLEDWRLGSERPKAKGKRRKTTLGIDATNSEQQTKTIAVGLLKYVAGSGYKASATA